MIFIVVRRIWLTRVTLGHYDYYAVLDNIHNLNDFVQRLPHL